MLAGADPSERNGLSLVARPHLVWARSIEIAEEFEQSELFTVVFDLLRTAGHDVVTMADAMVLASAHVGEHPRDLVARRAVGLLRRALVFLGGDPGHVGVAGGASVGVAVHQLEGEGGEADRDVLRPVG
jgi:hypothetical protein